MSNPGVITLAYKKLIDGKNIRVEDNIGEAIHIHYEDFRIDLTVKEFQELIRTVEKTLDQLIEVENFHIKDYDPVFLDMMSEQLPDLVEVKDDVIYLEDIKIATKGFLGLPVVRKLKKSHMYKALLGDIKVHEQYIQENRRGESNIQRLSRILESVKKNGYPNQGQYMIFYNNQNNIRDGQHRAASLYFLNGNMEVPIKRFIFKENKYNLSQHPWVYVLFVWDRKRVKKCLRILICKVRCLVRRIVDKCYAVVIVKK